MESPSGMCVVDDNYGFDDHYTFNDLIYHDILDIDILISYGEYPVNEVHRISLVEENGSYKIDNLN